MKKNIFVIVFLIVRLTAFSNNEEGDWHLFEFKSYWKNRLFETRNQDGRKFHIEVDSLRKLNVKNLANLDIIKDDMNKVSKNSIRKYLFLWWVFDEIIGYGYYDNIFSFNKQQGSLFFANCNKKNKSDCDSDKKGNILMYDVMDKKIKIFGTIQKRYGCDITFNVLKLDTETMILDISLDNYRYELKFSKL